MFELFNKLAISGGIMNPMLTAEILCRMVSYNEATGLNRMIIVTAPVVNEKVFLGVCQNS